MPSVEEAGIHPRIRMNGECTLVLIRDKREEPVCPLSSLHFLLLYRRDQVFLRGNEPHLDESHGDVRPVVDLRVPNASAHCSMLCPSFLEDAAFASLVGMAEFPFRAIGDDLNVMMGMKGPDGTGR
jgi:hypothetical protein